MFEIILFKSINNELNKYFLNLTSKKKINNNMILGEYRIVLILTKYFKTFSYQISF